MESSSSAAPCWSNIVKQHKEPVEKRNQLPEINNAVDRILVGSCKSARGIAVAVVDANAIINGGQSLTNAADRFISVPEVINEVRDPASRHSLNFLPFTVDTVEPSPEALRTVINFARATGDLQTLSDIDLKLIALTYTLEAQIHGTKHLRDSPPPIHTVNVKRLPEKDMPGWGSNVPNLEEWEALEHVVDEGSIPNSRILPLKDLNLNIIPPDEKNPSIEDGSIEEDDNGNFKKPKKKEVSIEGKKMVADGIDASQGQFDDDNAGDWRPAVSRSTHRRYLRRKARREMHEASTEDGQQDSTEKTEDELPKLVVDEFSEESRVENGNQEENDKKNEDLSSILNQMRLEEDSLMDLQGGKDEEVESGEVVHENGEGKEHLEETASQTVESVDASCMDDNSSEQSWTLRSLSESSVACITSDFAMQNVLLQMGLRLLAPGGMQIRELHRWILRCHACNKVTMEIGKIFCPSCGNGGTLRKVAVTVNENGIVVAARRQCISLRGTRYSLPLPRGGRDSITKNPILREDQLPQKFLYPKTKKNNKQGSDDDVFASMDMFLHHTDKKAPLQPPIRKAIAIFGGRRNPNDSHYSRSKKH